MLCRHEHKIDGGGFIPELFPGQLFWPRVMNHVQVDAAADDQHTAQHAGSDITDEASAVFQASAAGNSNNESDLDDNNGGFQAADGDNKELDLEEDDEKIGPCCITFAQPVCQRCRWHPCSRSDFRAGRLGVHHY
jgi:hypothetical protein